MNKHLNLLFTTIGILFLVIIVNIFTGKQNTQVDFTEEKRYTLSPSTTSLLKNLDEPVEVFVFLKDNHLPTDFKRLQQSTRDLLQSYKKLSNGLVRFRFENPVEGLTGEERQETMQELQRRGITPTNVRIKTNDGYTENLMFPGALINYKDRQFPVMLLSGQRGRGAINQSIELLEYQFANAISKLQLNDLPTIGFAAGNDELTPLETRSLRQSLAQNFYRPTTINLPQIDSIPQDLNLLVIAQPKESFSTQDKFKIDQYIMQGGKTLWALDMMKMNMDSLRTVWQGENVAVDYNLGIDEQLFQYGVRINRNLIRDLQSKPIPVVIDENGQTELFPWSFFPVVSGGDSHITTENINPVSFEFVSSIDTLSVPGIETSVLLKSSDQAGVVANPVLVSLQELRNPPPNASFSLSNLPMAVLLEGQFPSLFEYRASPVENWQTERKDLSEKTKMVVISDGDILANEVRPDGQIFPLGFDRSLGEQFGNTEFLLNVIDYLVIENNVLEARNKQVTMRLLNQTKVAEEKAKWQILAFVVPIVFLLLISGLFYFVRKRRFG